MPLRSAPTTDEWYEVWRAHPPALPGFSQRQSSKVYTTLGLDPRVAKWAGKRSFVTIVNKGVPVDMQMRIRGDGGTSNADLVRDWQHREAAEAARPVRAEADEVELARGKKRRLQLLTQRQGQQGFRAALLDAYEGRCAITGVAVHAVLQAAHVEPYDGEATNVVTNGLLLRADLHNLFDAHLMWIDDDLNVRVAESVRDVGYREWDGRPLRLPSDPSSGPAMAGLRAHRRACGAE